MSVGGDAQEDFSFIPGRSSLELASALYQLEAFCLRCDELKSGKMDKDSVPFFEDLGLEDLGLLSLSSFQSCCLIGLWMPVAFVL
jgi:hypothetical protein